MENNLFNLLLLTFVGSTAGLIGGIVLLLKKSWAKNLSLVSVPLAAGVLLSISFLDLLPESYDSIGENSFTIIFAVFVILFFVERFLFFFHHHDEMEDNQKHNHSSQDTSIPLIILGDTIHNLIDGMVIGATFLVNPYLASFVAFSTFLHETPHEIADFGILLNKGWSTRKTFMVNLYSSLATFVGAILTYYNASKFEEGTGYLLAIAAGFFLYVATTDFLPEASHAPKKFIFRQSVFFLGGIAMVVLVRHLFPEISH